MRAPISIVATALCGIFSVAVAQEYCVTCTGPDATYRCMIGGDGAPAAKSSRGQLLCITELARAGGHASCGVTRNTEAPCAGELKTVMFPQAPVDPNAPPMADAPPPGMTAPQGAEPGTDAAAAPGGEPAADEPKPSTVADLTKKTIDKTGEGIEKAGNAVGNAVKKTWKCLSSFFGDC